ncbi:MAG TPA: sulfur carrier protein ThiS [Gammaproteobacteria bacterium]|nr:sulfur carrier protein ThiS [Gammaproteobacteria bacterium]
MNIELNGSPVQLAAGTVVSDLIHSLGLANTRLAVEINTQIIPSSQHDRHRLQQDDKIEVVTAIGGG